MTTMIINLMLTASLNKQVEIPYKSMDSCVEASKYIEKMLDLLNEKQILGYSWRCEKQK